MRVFCLTLSANLVNIALPAMQEQGWFSQDVPDPGLVSRVFLVFVGNLLESSHRGRVVVFLGVAR